MKWVATREWENGIKSYDHFNIWIDSVSEYERD